MSTATFSYHQIKNVIREFTGQTNVISTPRVFVKMTGDHVAAMFLGQLLYWTERTNDPDGWIYKSAKDWNEELEMSRSQVDRVSKMLGAWGVETKLKKANNAPTLHYRIDMSRFIPLFLQFLDNQKRGSDIEQSAKSMDIQESSKTNNIDYTETTDPHFQENAPVVQNVLFEQPEAKRRGRKPRSDIAKVQAEELKSSPEHQDYLRRKKEIEAVYVELIGYKPVEYGATAKAGKALAEAGYDGSHVRGCWKHMIAADFWAKKKAAGEHIELASIAKNIPAWWNMEQARVVKAERALAAQQEAQAQRQKENATKKFLSPQEMAEKSRALRAQQRVSASNQARV